jgi:hypothetical protein
LEPAFVGDFPAGTVAVNPTVYEQALCVDVFTFVIEVATPETCPV